MLQRWEIRTGSVSVGRGFCSLSCCGLHKNTVIGHSAVHTGLQFDSLDSMPTHHHLSRYPLWDTINDPCEAERRFPLGCLHDIYSCHSLTVGNFIPSSQNFRSLTTIAISWRCSFSSIHCLQSTTCGSRSSFCDGPWPTPTPI
jgi:hypothetical protein